MGQTRVITAVAIFVAAGSAGAGVVSSQGDLLFLSKAPSSVQAGMLESDDYAYYFHEGFVKLGPFSGGINVDISIPGNYDSFSDLTPDEVSGDVLESYFFHQDPVGMGNRNGNFSDFRVYFDTPILGIIVLGDNNGQGGGTLDLTDSLSMTGTVYPGNGDGVFRGTLDSTSRLDQIGWGEEEGREYLDVGWLSNTFGIDQMRVITGYGGPTDGGGAVPGPGAVAALGLMALGMGRRRRDR